MPTPRKERDIQTLEHINSASPGTPSGMQFHKTLHGTVYYNSPIDFPSTDDSSPSTPAACAGIKVFKVNGSYEDVIVGNEVTYTTYSSSVQFTETLSGTNTIIAKPWDLRKNGAGHTTGSLGSSGSLTISTDTKTYSNGITTILTETIQPPYIGGYVVAVNLASIELSGSVSASLAGAGISWNTGSSVNWTDINADGRQWDCGYHTLDICQLVGGVPTQKAVQVKSGLIYSP